MDSMYSASPSSSCVLMPTSLLLDTGVGRKKMPTPCDVPVAGEGALPAAGSWGWRVRLRCLRSVPPPGGAGRGGVRAARPARAAMGGGDLYALDFDDVFCNSCGRAPSPPSRPPR